MERGHQKQIFNLFARPLSELLPRPENNEKSAEAQPGLLQINKVVKCEDTTYVYLSGINCGRCLNRKRAARTRTGRTWKFRKTWRSSSGASARTEGLRSVTTRRSGAGGTRALARCSGLLKLEIVDGKRSTQNEENHRTNERSPTTSERFMARLS